MPFISFLFLITVAKTSNIMSNRSVKREPFCLISDFRAKAFKFLIIKYDVSCRFL